MTERIYIVPDWGMIPEDHTGDESSRWEDEHGPTFGPSPTDLDAPIPLMPDELDRRMDARRANRPQPLDLGTVLIVGAVALLFGYIVMAAVWGAMR